MFIWKALKRIKGERTLIKDKEFDSVKMMRDIRDRISRDIENMTLEEEKKYLQKVISSSK